MDSNVAEAFVTVRPSMDRFGGDLRSGLGKLAKVAGAAALGIAAAIGGAAVAGVKKFAELERGMNEVFTLLPDISEQAMGQMTEDVRDFAVEMGVATDEVVPALYAALSAGVPRENVFEFMETATKASIAGITDLDSAVSVISATVNAYGDQISGAGEASDLIFTAVRLGVTTFEEMSASLSNVVPIAAANKVAFGDVAAAIATMTAQGTKTPEATTQLRQALVEMSDSGTNAGEAFERLAGTSLPEFMTAGGNLADALAIMQEAADEAGVPIQQMFGSVEAGNAVMQLSGENMEGFRGNLAEMEGSAGATDAAFQTMNQGLSRTWDRIKVVFDELLLELGERIAPALQGFADWFEENLPGIIEWFERMGEKAGEMGEALAEWWTETAKPAIDEFVAAVQDNWPKVEEIFESLGRVVAAIADIFSKELGNMSGATGEETGSIEEDVTNLIDTVNGLATTAATVTEAVAGSWNFLAGAVKADFDQMGRGIDDLTGGGYSRFRDRTFEVTANVARAFREGVDEIVGWFRELPGRLTSALSGLGGLLTGIGRDIIGGLFGGMRSAWDNSVGWLGSLGGRIRDLKGPIEKDRVLLDDIGEEIIGGLGRGMAREWAAVERQLGIMTAELPAAISATNVGGTSAPTSVTIPVMLTGVDGIAREVGRSEAFFDSYGRVSSKRSRLTAGA